MTAADNVLRVRNLTIGFGGPQAVRGVSFDIVRGQRVGLVGESGSGKSLTARGVLGLLPVGAIAAGAIDLDGIQVLNTSDRQASKWRGSKVGYISQDALAGLDPLWTVGRQVAEPLRLANRRQPSAERKERVRELLHAVQLPDVDRAFSAYPHELSGGQRQRVMIAAALAAEPDLLIADEPTTALDATVQREILTLLNKLVEDAGMSMLFITHDLASVTVVCDSVMVMYAGRIVERGPVTSVLGSPNHPYTLGLVGSTPSLRIGTKRGDVLPSIEGSVPALGSFPSGCSFRNRCQFESDECTAAPEPRAITDRVVECWNPVNVGVV